MISIIIITKNEEKLLPKLLDSIKKQKNIRHEIIVSDAKSSDNTRKIAKKYKCKIVNGGMPSVGRNNGAKKSKYDLLLFLDADVILPNDFLKELLFEMNRRELDCGTVFYKPATKDKSIKAMYFLYNWYAYLMQYILPHSGGLCIFVKKSVFSKLKGFNEKMLMNEDHDFVTRASKIGKFRVLKDFCVDCDIRRIKIEGKSIFLKKYIKGGIYRIIFGDRLKPAFDYKLHGCDDDITKIYKQNT